MEPGPGCGLFIVIMEIKSDIGIVRLVGGIAIKPDPGPVIPAFYGGRNQLRRNTIYGVAVESVSFKPDKGIVIIRAWVIVNLQLVYIRIRIREVGLAIYRNWNHIILISPVPQYVLGRYCAYGRINRISAPV
jgi:hypothetical protein